MTPSGVFWYNCIVLDNYLLLMNNQTMNPKPYFTAAAEMSLNRLFWYEKQTRGEYFWFCFGKRTENRSLHITQGQFYDSE